MSISITLRNEALMLDNFTCVYCGYRGSDVTIDHLIPELLDGPDVIQNLLTACKPCNSRKSDRGPYECGMVTQFGRYALIPVGNQIAAKNRRGPRPLRYRSKREQNLAELYDLGFTDEQIQAARHDLEIIRAMLGAGLSGNKIAAVLGGDRNKVLAEVRRARGVEEAKAAA